MNKISYLRSEFIKQFNSRNFSAAVETGDILLREHWHNRFMWTKGYADDLYNIACVHDEMGNLERAAELYSDSARQIAVVEGESYGYAVRLSNLAIVLGRMGIVEPAFFIHGQVVSIFKNRMDRHSPKYANSLYNLANAAIDAGHKREAFRYHMDALKIREKISNKTGDTTDVVNSLHSIAFLYESSNDNEKAAAYAKAALDISDGDDNLTAVSCNYLAGLYERMEKYDEALPLYGRVQEIIRQQVSTEHSAYLNVAFRRASLLAKMKRPREALECHEEIRDTFLNMSGEKHIFYANCLRNMAILHNGLGEYHEAENLILESIKIRRDIDDITADIVFLIRLYMSGGDREKAIEALIYALMRASSDAKNVVDLVDALAGAFTDPNFISEELLSAMESLNDIEKLAPIISKWVEWESS